MKILFNYPLVLLLCTGTSLAMFLPLGQLARSAGIDIFLWAALLSLIPGAIVGAIALAQGTVWNHRQLWRYGVVAGTLASVIPNVTLLHAIPHIGSGLAGVMYALSPVVTALLSLLLGVRPPGRFLLLGIGFGFFGALVIVSGRNALEVPEASGWLLLSLIVPCSLALGNVYRTKYWPEGATPLQIATVANLTVAPVLFALSVLLHGNLSLSQISNNPMLALAQWTASLAMLLVFFKLQKVGGPTYLSQIGYVAAAVALAIGTVVFGESYPWQVWVGAGCIAVGIVISFGDKG